MAKQGPMQLIPSGGVLAAAIGAGLVAAILINIYASSIRSQYEDGSKLFYVLKDNVAAGNPIQEQNLERVRVQSSRMPAFCNSLPSGPRSSLTGGLSQRAMVLSMK